MYCFLVFIFTCVFLTALGEKTFHTSIDMPEELERSSIVANLDQLMNLALINTDHSSVGPKAMQFGFMESSNLFFIDSSRQGRSLLRVNSRIDREADCSASYHQFCCTNQLRLDLLGPVAEISQQPTKLIDVCRLTLLFIVKLNYESNSTSSPIKPLDEDVLLHLTIRLLDVNDNTPNWFTSMSDKINAHQLPKSIPVRNDLIGQSVLLSSTIVTIKEHSELGSKLSIPFANDPDAPPENTTASYSIIWQQVPDSFTLEWLAGSGRDSERGLFLRVNKELDYDVTPNQLLIISASDAGHLVRLTGYLLVNVSIEDINDHPPEFIEHKVVVTISEHLAQGSRLFEPKVRELDESDRPLLSYKHSVSTPPEVQALFRINQKTGLVTVVGSIDFEKAQYYRLKMSVSDGKWSDEMELIILIVNVDDHVPEISLNSHLIINPLHHPPSSHFPQLSPRPSVLSRSQMIVYVEENGPTDQMIATLTLTDRDHLAELRGIEQLKVLAKELVNELSLARKIQQAIQSAEQRVRMPSCQLKNSPLFHIEHLRIISKQSVADGRHRFKISLAGKSLDRELQSQLTVSIECREQSSFFDQSVNNPNIKSRQGSRYAKFRSSATAVLTVIVLDVNDSKPTFKGPFSFKLREGMPIGATVGFLQANDADDPSSLAGQSGLRFKLLEGSDSIEFEAKHDSADLNYPTIPKPWFHLDSVSGELRVATVFDREVVRSVRVTFRISDGGGSDVAPQNSINSTVRVRIEDVNDCSPDFSQPVYNFNISEDARPPFKIGQVAAVDCDVDERNRVSDYWLESMYLKDDDDNSNIPVGESSSNHAALFSVTKTGEVFLSLASSSSTSRPNSHVSLDHESNKMILLYVYARDSGHPQLTGTAQVLVHVQDVNDHSPSWEFPRPDKRLVNLPSNTSVGDRVARLVATDPDAGPRGQVNYSILSGNEANHFELVTDTGWIYLAKPFDQVNQDEIVNGRRQLPNQSKTGSSTINHHPSIIRLYVQVSDNGQPSRTSSSVLDILIQRPSRILGPHRSDHGLVGSYQSNLELTDYTSDTSSSTRRRQPSNQNHPSKVHRQPGFLMSTDLLTLTALIAATLAALLLVFILFIFIRCRRIKATNANRPSRVDRDNDKPRVNNDHTSPLNRSGEKMIPLSATLPPPCSASQGIYREQRVDNWINTVGVRLTTPYSTNSRGPEIENADNEYTINPSQMTFNPIHVGQRIYDTSNHPVLSPTPCTSSSPLYYSGLCSSENYNLLLPSNYTSQQAGGANELLTFTPPKVLLNNARQRIGSTEERSPPISNQARAANSPSFHHRDSQSTSSTSCCNQDKLFDSQQEEGKLPTYLIPSGTEVRKTPVGKEVDFTPRRDNESKICELGSFV